MGNSCQIVQQQNCTTQSIAKKKVNKLVPLPNLQNKVEKFNYPLHENLDSFEEDFYHQHHIPNIEQQESEIFFRSKEATFDGSEKDKCINNKFEYWLSYQKYSRSSVTKSLHFINQSDRAKIILLQNNIQQKKRLLSSKRISRSNADLKSILKRNLSHSPQLSHRHVHFDSIMDQLQSSKLKEKQQRNIKYFENQKQSPSDDFTLISRYKIINRQFVIL